VPWSKIAIDAFDESTWRDAVADPSTSSQGATLGFAALIAALAFLFVLRWKGVAQRPGRVFHRHGSRSHTLALLLFAAGGTLVGLCILALAVSAVRAREPFVTYSFAGIGVGVAVMLASALALAMTSEGRRAAKRREAKVARRRSGRIHDVAAETAARRKLKGSAGARPDGGSG
jgi:hypothetical protein